MSIKENIEQAKTDKEIDKLLKQGESFVYAPDKTKRRWQTVANARRKELGIETPKKKSKKRLIMGIDKLLK